MPEIQKIAVHHIHVSKRLREVTDVVVVEAMAESLEECGLLTPISVRIVRMVEGDETRAVPVLVAGAHRLAAAKRLGWEFIDAVSTDGDELNARLRYALKPILEPVDGARRACEKVGDEFWRRFALWGDLDENAPAKHREEALRRLRILPPSETLARWLPAFRDAAKKAATEELMLLIGLMIDSYHPQQVANPDVYRDVLIYVTDNEQDGFSAYAIACAVIVVLRSMECPPAPSEFLEIVRRQQLELTWDRGRVERLARTQNNALWIAIDNGDRESPWAGEVCNA